MNCNYLILGVVIVFIIVTIYKFQQLEKKYKNENFEIDLADSSLSYMLTSNKLTVPSLDVVGELNIVGDGKLKVMGDDYIEKTEKMIKDTTDELNNNIDELNSKVDGMLDGTVRFTKLDADEAFIGNPNRQQLRIRNVTVTPNSNSMVMHTTKAASHTLAGLEIKTGMIRALKYHIISDNWTNARVYGEQFISRNFL